MDYNTGHFHLSWRKILRSRYRYILVILILFIASMASAARWRIMPVGDSITDGYPFEPGFLDDLHDLLTTSGVDFEFVGPDGTAPYKGLFLSGAKIENFYQGESKDIGAAISSYHPNMILVHLGTNNYSDQASPYSTDGGNTLLTTTASGKLAKVLKLASNYSSIERILVCKIISQQENGTLENPQVQLFNAEIDNMFFDRPAGIAVDKMTLIDMYSKLELSDYSDTRHPNESGYSKMADEYGRVIKGINAGDLINPGRISWVRGEVLNKQNGTIQLQWHAPGDDGYTGRANLYELRYSEYSLADFQDGILVPGINGPGTANSTESLVMTGLIPEVTYHFYIRAWDELNNKGQVSEEFNLYIEPNDIPEYTDDFEDAAASDEWWDLNSWYSVQNGQLYNTNPSGSWTDLATYKRATYSPNAEYVETSFKYIQGGDLGMAMMLDDSTSSANGYFIFIRSNRLRLYAITNGTISTGEIHSISTSVVPEAGDELIVQAYPNSAYGHAFEVSVNKASTGTVYVGNVHDVAKLYGNSSLLYSGVMLYGGNNYAIDDFKLKIPPLPAHSMEIYAGNNETGRVTKKLAKSLTVQVLDINGLPVPDEPIDFQITSGTGFLSTHPDSIEQEFNNNVWVEAEDGNLQLPMTSQNDIEASGNQYISVIPAVDDQGQGNNGLGSADYQVYIPVAGHYKLWLRVLAASGVSNSCYVTVNNSSEYRWDFESRSYWQWATGAENGFNLPSGFITMNIRNRESGTQFDKILLTRNSSYTPTNDGEETQPFSFITNASGLARTEITFDTQSGPVDVTASANVSVGSPQVFTVYAQALDPESIYYNSPPSYPGVAGNPLDIDFSIFLKDIYNNPCTGIAVDFKVISGDGTFNGTGLDSTRLSTDVDGTASIQLTLGYEQETVVQASLPDYPLVSPVEFKGIAGEGIPVIISATNGQNQTGTVRQTLPQHLTVKVLDEKNEPVENYPVPFAVTKGNGLLDGAESALTAKTGSDGQASVTYTLGDTAGTSTNEVTVDVNLPGAPIIFSPIAQPDSPYRLTKVAGDQQETTAGKRFPDSLRVMVTDQYNNGISGHSVGVSVVSGDGNFDGNEGVSVSNDAKILATDSRGIATTVFAAGNTVGENQVKFEGQPALQEGSPATFSLTVLPRVPNQVTKVSGDSPVQSGVVNNLLASPFKVKVIDPFGINMGAGVNVVMKVVSGGGKFSSQDSVILQTIADGTASATLKLGTVAGTQTVKAYLPDYPAVASVQFTATATPAAAAKMTVASVNPFTYKAGYSPVALQVKVTDEYENPYPGHTVKFQISQGNGSFPGNSSPANVSTNSQGIASINYQMGTDIEITNLISASSTKTGSQTALTGSPLTFRGFVIPDTANSIVKISGDSPVQQGTIGTQLTEPLTIQVRDQYNNPVPEQAVIFKVLTGDGRIGSETEVTRFTDESGQTFVYYTLGFSSGTNSDSVQVIVENRSDIEPVVFKASALPGVPEAISAWQDSVWTNLVLGSSQLFLTPKVMVTDIRNNPVPGVSVTFKVTDGGGTVNNTTQATALTGTNGIAQVTWKLSANPDTNIVTASASYNNVALYNSPVTFWASTTPGVPFYLTRVSAENDTGIANQRLSSPFKVQVTDANYHPIAGQPIQFQVMFPAEAPKGKFILDDDSMVDEAQVTTNENGYAQVYFQPVLGINTVKAHSVYNNITLQTDRLFYVSGTAPQAREIRLLSQKSDTATVRDTLSIRVGAYDVDGYPVEKHTINYKVIKGNGYLASTEINKSFQSTLNGVATERWILGNSISAENWLEISSSDGENQLPGSPDTVKVRMLADQPFPDSTVISATSDILANGTAYSTVTVHVYDRYNNPVSGQTILITSAHTGVTIEGPTSKTNTSGLVTAKVRSTVADTVDVQISLSATPVVPLGSARIVFKAGSASRIVMVSGNSQTGNKGSILKDLFVVKTTDLYNNPVANVDVEFSTRNGDGFHAGSGLNTFTVKSDSTGQASALWVLGPNTGEQIVDAIIKNLGQTSPIAQFSITSRNAVSPLHMVNKSQPNLTGTAGVAMDQPLLAGVFDKDTLAVAGKSVTFSTTATGAQLIGDNPAISDYNGCARITLQPGTHAGVQQVTGRITGDTTSVKFNITVNSDSVKSISAISATTVTDTVGLIIADTLTIAAKDKHNNPVSGIPIIFTLADAPGETHNAQFVGSDTAWTNAQGHAQAIFKLGRLVGEYIISARTPVLDANVLFTVHAIHGVPAKLAMVSGNYQVMTKNRFLVYPNVVKLTDSYSNIVPDETVYFQPKNFIGSVSSTIDTTDSLGRAFCYWQLGDQAENILWVSKPGTQPNYVEFTATGVDNAFPVFTNLSRSDSVDYTLGEFQYQVQASDADGDPLTYGIQNLPGNATFNSSTGMFAWVPKPNQKRTWNIVFEVYDNKPSSTRGFDVDSLTITITGNSAPSIISMFPPNPDIDVAMGESEKFTVVAQDPDTDPMTYTWYLDNVEVGSGPEYTFVAEDHQGAHTLRCVVSDGTASSEAVWSRVTKVELENFSAEQVPYQGVRVDWKTAKEENNLGFFVYRSISIDGEYEKLNSQIIVPCHDGQYSYVDTSAAQGRTWYYKLIDISTSGWSGENGPVQLTTSLPSDFRVHQNFPNPFNPTTRIRFELPRALDTRIVIYNIMGQQVRTLLDENMKPGYHEVVWNGENGQGLKVASGVYYYRITAGDFKEVKKMAFIK